MGQKVNPIGLRLGVNRTWDSRWYAKKEEYGRLLHQDIEIRNELKKRLAQALLQHLAHAHVFMEQLGVVVLAGEPAAVPRAVDAEAQTDRIDFLTHYAASPSSRTTMVISENGFSIREALPRARAAKRFITRFLPTNASATTRESMSRLWLFSALEIAE